MVILKSYYEAIKTNESTEKKKEIINSYCDQLESSGWKYCVSEGAYVSPDEAVLFVVLRSPYVGQLLCNAKKLEKQFESYKTDMIQKEIFIER